MKQYKIRLDAKRQFQYWFRGKALKEIREKTGLNADFDNLGNLCFYEMLRPEGQLFKEKVILFEMKPPADYAEFLKSSTLKDNISLDLDLTGIKILRKGCKVFRIEVEYPEKLEQDINRRLSRSFHFKREGSKCHILYKNKGRWDFKEKTYVIHSLSKEETDEIVDFLIDPSDPLTLRLELPRFCLA